MLKLRVGLVLALAVAALAVLPSVASAAETVTVCGGSSDCPGAWVNHDVGVSFTWTDAGTGEVPSGCDPVTVSSEGDQNAAGHSITCTVTYPDSHRGHWNRDREDRQDAPIQRNIHAPSGAE